MIGRASPVESGAGKYAGGLLSPPPPLTIGAWVSCQKLAGRPQAITDADLEKSNKENAAWFVYEKMHHDFVFKLGLDLKDAQG